MSNKQIDDSLSDYYLQVNKYSSDVRDICKPLFEAFGIKHFFYYDVDEQGNNINLNTNPEFMEYYFRASMKDGSCDCVTLNWLRLFPKLGVYLDDLALDRWLRFPESLMRAYEKFDCSHGIRIIEEAQTRKGSMIRYYGFYTHRGNSDINHFFINHLDLLRDFGRGFKTRIRDIRRGLKPIKLSSQDVELVKIEFKRLQQEDPSLDRYRELAKTDYKDTKLPSIRHPLLSNRERQIMEVYVQGKTSVETASELNLSVHTVNTYIARVKSKLGVRSKHEALMLLLQK